MNKDAARPPVGQGFGPAAELPLGASFTLPPVAPAIFAGVLRQGSTVYISGDKPLVELSMGE
jgi:hypothetical protein